MKGKDKYMRREPTIIRRCLVVLLGMGAALSVTGAASASATWMIQPTPARTNSTLASVSCLAATDCNAVGSYVSHGVRVTLAEHWNGTSWTVQATPNPAASGDSLSGISCLSATDCLAVGNTISGASMLALAWNGSSWRQIQSPPEPADGSFASLAGVSCVPTVNCMAVGAYTQASNGAMVPLTESWNGSTWTVRSTPVPPRATNRTSLSAVSCTSPSQCTAVGTVHRQHGIIAVLAERWNGNTWVIQDSSNPQNSRFSDFFGVSCSSATSCIAVGQTQSGSIVATLAETWTGGPWTVQKTPQPRGGVRNQLNDVSCLSPSNCTAVGGTTARAQLPLIYSWNGTTWRPEAPGRPATNDNLSGVSCVSTGTCSAVGDIASPTGVTTSSLAEQD